MLWISILKWKTYDNAIPFLQSQSSAICSSKFQLPIHGTNTSIQTLPFRPPPPLARRSTPHPFLSHPTLNSIIQPSPPPSVTLLPHKQLISLSYTLDRLQQHPSTATRLSSSLSSFGRHLARAWLFCPQNFPTLRTTSKLSKSVLGRLLTFASMYFHGFPIFKPSKPLIPFVDVWIRLLELSIEYYDKEVFQKIAEAIGVYLVKIDPVTERLEKCMFARICIRITLCNGNPLILSIQFGEIQQKIEYEGLDSLCHDCGCFYDLKHDCLNQNNPFGSSGFDPHQHRPHPSSGSKKPLIHSLPQNQDWDPNPMKKTHFLS